MKAMIAVDESPFSSAALEWVKRASWKKEDEFLVVSAAAPFWLGPGEAVAADAIVQLTQRQQEFHREICEAGARQLSESGIRAKAKLLLGDPRHALIDEARRERVDLLVLGSHGRTGIAKLLLGSVASHIVAHAPCSVLVVRRPAESSSAA